MKKCRLKIKSKNLFDNFIKAYIIISSNLFFLVYNGLCHELVDRAKRKDKIIGHISNTTVLNADFIEYLSYKPTSLPSSITQKAIDQQLYEMITIEALYKEVVCQSIHQNSYARRIIRHISPLKLLEEEIERDAWAKPIEEENFQTYYEQHKCEFSRCEQVYLTNIFISLYLDTMPDLRIERV